MSIEWSNFKASLTGIKRCADALKTLTIVAAIAYAMAAPQAAEAQNLNITIGGGPSVNTGGLPPTNLDSFVYQAGGAAADIYGDESTGLPPLFGYTQASRINAGITGQNAAGLTTGHGSYMPCAGGADEFLASPGEWCTTGANGGPSISASALDAMDLTEAAIGFGSNLFNIGSATSGLTAGIGGLSGGISLPGVGGLGVSVGAGGVSIGGGGNIGGVSIGGSSGFGF
jgi:hypothetical protein